MSGIADAGVVELAAVLAAFQGGLRVAERLIDGLLGLRRNGAAQKDAPAGGQEWAAAVREQTAALQEVTKLLHGHFEQAARSMVTQETILHEIRAHDQAMRRRGGSTDGGG